VSLVQVRALEIHSWGATADDPDAADHLVFDLDPGAGIAWSDLVAAAVLLRMMLQKLGLESFAKTSGSKGLHVVIPLNPAVDWSVAKPFTRAIAERLAADHPDRYVSRMDKSLRHGRIFVDYLRNGRGATCVTAFSARAKTGAPISAPVSWTALARLKGADLSVSGIVTVRIGYGPTVRPITTPMETATSATSGLVAMPGILAATLRVGPIRLWPAPLEKIKAGGDCPPALIRTIRGRCVQAIV